MSRRHLTLACAVLGVALALAPSHGIAGELKLSTIRLDLSKGQPRSSVSVTNIGAVDTLVHIRAARWKQIDGNDVLEPAPEMAVNPPMVRLAAGTSQLVRVGYLASDWPVAEGTYRLFIEEVPIADRGRSQTIETFLRLSVPVFLEPAAPPQRSLQVSWTANGHALLLENGGNKHLRLHGYELMAQGVPIGKPYEKLNYVLAHSAAPLAVVPLSSGAGKADAVKFTTEEGELVLRFGEVRTSDR